MRSGHSPMAKSVEILRHRRKTRDEGLGEYEGFWVYYNRIYIIYYTFIYRGGDVGAHHDAPVSGDS